MPIQTSFASPVLPPWLEALYRNLAERSEALSREPYQAYPGQRLAPLAPEYERSGRYIQQGGEAFPEAYQRYMNPYLDAVVNQIATRGTRNFKENIMPALEAAFVGYGAHGSSRHQELAQRAARDLQEKILEQQQQALHQGYGQAANIHASDAARAFTAAQATQGLGGIKQGHQQQGLNLAYQDFLNQKNYPREQLGAHSNIMQGVPHQHGVLSAAAQPEFNTAGNIGNIAGGLYGAGLAYGKFKRGGTAKIPFTNPLTKAPKVKGMKGLSKMRGMKKPKAKGMSKMKGMTGLMQSLSPNANSMPKVGGAMNIPRGI